MPNTLGAHIIKSAYGQWLPGDERGHWSTAWDEQLGYVQPHMLHPGDPVRKRMAEERMKAPSLLWTESMIAAMTQAIAQCAVASAWNIAALAIEPTHFHLLIGSLRSDLDRTCKWLSQQITKAVHAATDHPSRIFARGKWASFVYDESHWNNAIAYINRHPGAVTIARQSP